MSIDWRHLYLILFQQNKKLKKQIEVLETILRTHLPIIKSKRLDDE